MITNTDIKIQYSPSVATSGFAFPITYFEEEDVNVEIVDTNGATTVLTLNAVSNGFTVVPVNGDPEQGATITTTETYTSGDTVTIYRDIPKTQLAEFTRGGTLPPEVLNKALDRNTAISQEVAEQGLRHISCPITDPDTTTYEVPALDLRKNTVVGFDSNGDVTAVSLVTSGAIGANEDEGVSISGNIISAKVDDTSMEFDGIGNISIKDLGVTNAMLAGSITTAKLNDKTGIDTDVATGTAGADGQLVGWNADGDVIDSGFDVTNDDNLGTSDTTLATQGNIKAYVDAQIALGVAEYATQFADTEVVATGTVPNTWTEVDISSIVGANNALCVFKFVSTHADSLLYMRSSDETADVGDGSTSVVVGANMGRADSGNTICMVIYTGTDGKFDWWGEDATGGTTTGSLRLMTWQKCQ